MHGSEAMRLRSLVRAFVVKVYQNLAVFCAKRFNKVVVYVRFKTHVGPFPASI